MYKNKNKKKLHPFFIFHTGNTGFLTMTGNLLPKKLHCCDTNVNVLLYFRINARFGDDFIFQ